ncbi:MAG: hypothetical protein ACREOF_07620 [Gemmatimonadales bacterium]
MYATIRRYEILTPDADAGAKQQLLDIIREDFLPRVSDLPGFDGYFVLDTGSRGLATVSLFETEEGIAASTRLAADAVTRYAHIARLSPPEITSGRVVMHRESSRLVSAS